MDKEKLRKLEDLVADIRWYHNMGLDNLKEDGPRKYHEHKKILDKMLEVAHPTEPGEGEGCPYCGGIEGEGGPGRCPICGGP